MNHNSSLRNIRKQTQLTQADISHLLGGANISTIAHIEQEEPYDSLNIIITYILLFGKSLVELFPDVGEKTVIQLKETIPSLLVDLDGMLDDEFANSEQIKSRIEFLENLFARLMSENT